MGVSFAWIEKDTRKGETRTPEYLAMNANGKVPLLEITPGQYLAESNAILCYLAEGTPYLPQDRWQRAHVMQWLFFEQYSHEPYLAVARSIRKFLPSDDARRADLPRLHARGHQALAVMEQQLAEHAFFAGGQYSIADIALYAYTPSPMKAVSIFPVIVRSAAGWKGCAHNQGMWPWPESGYP